MKRTAVVLVLSLVAVAPRGASTAGPSSPTIEQHQELVVNTVDTHEPLLHQRYLYAFSRLEEFLGRFLKGTPPRSTAGGQ